MALLKSVTRGKISKPPIVMVHGKPGMGKSTWASQAPNPLFVSLEEGTNELDVARTDNITNWDQCIALLGELINEEHDYQTVVWDTVDAAEMMIWKNICERENVKSIELAAGGFGKGYKLALEDYWTWFVDGLKTLRDKRNVGSILLCHSVDREQVTAQNENYLRSEPKLFVSSNGKTDVTDYLVGQCDACGFFAADIKTVDNADKDRKIAKGGLRRQQHWYPAPTHLAKNRYGIEEPLPLDKDNGFATFLAARKVD